MKIGPQSLVGQVLLALAAGLFVAQAISATLLYRANENRRDEALVNTLAVRLAQAKDPASQAARHRRSTPNKEPRLGRFRSVYASDFTIQKTDTRLADAEKRLRAVFAGQEVPIAEIVVVKRAPLDDPMILSRPSLQERILARAKGGQQLYLAAMRSEGDSRWRVARALEMPRNKMATSMIIAQTMLIYAILMGLIYLILRRITRPLSALTSRTRKFGLSATLDNSLPEQRPDQLPEQLPEEGPSDVRRLIAAHNAMEARVIALLDEKDVMLGAIGHDLKTPLAALRVRIETVKSETERDSMAQTIREIDNTLDEILALARIGHAQERAEPTDLGALAQSVISEFEDTGSDVRMEEGQRVVHTVRPTWLKRALRNLVANAVRYGGAATVSITQSDKAQSDKGAILQVDDRGPGIPEADLAAMCAPFARGDTSRNRSTGGTGLGLTIARAIAERHGGTLILANREGGGLRAQIHLPG